MKDGEECEMYQTDMERVLSHNITWWMTECRRMELDYAKRIENRENRLAKMDTAIDTIKALLAGKTVEVNTGQAWLDNICIDLREKLKEVDNEDS